jgi:AcrR family transcriptional regulator
VVVAAMTLFARYGVAGTSLQMIADEVGVTKAAVYHQFQAKEDIVRAATEIEFARLQSVIEAAEAAGDATAQRDAVIVGIVDLSVSRRRTISTVLSDPVIVEVFHDDETFRDVSARLQQLLSGGAPSADGGVETVMLIAAISGTVIHPFAKDLDDDVLREQLVRLARRFLAIDA